MPSYKKKTDFFQTEAGLEVVQVLRNMAEDVKYNTESGYSANSETYPDNLIPFVDKHMDYLRSHPSMDPQQYLSNLRLMTLIR
jgi:hypothetical protein